jgi:hypothetical protein
VSVVGGRIEHVSSIGGGDLDLLSGPELLAVFREQERIKHQADLVELAVIAKLEARNVAFDLGAKNTVDLLRHACNIGARDAGGRVKLAAAVTERTTLTGVPVEPAHPQTAAALGAGQISVRAAGTIVRTVDAISDFVVDEAGPLFETSLIDFARDHDPETLGKYAHGLKIRLDQDGAYRDLERAQRRRGITPRRRPDGSGPAEVELTSELHEYLATVFDTFGKPHPGPNGERDLRTPAQRRHDALLEAMKLLFASGRLPTVNGCATTLVLHADVDDFAQNQGVAWTANGVAVPMGHAKGWLDPEARAILVLLSKTKGIVAYSDKHRLFTEQQRLAMFARDKGCSYWGCDATFAWTQAHHMTDWAITRRTSVDDGALACSANHATFERMGWRSEMINGYAHWIPPSWVDPEQRPRRNHVHD